jgi:glycosyltransferase involved in cell wall biosynthesis
VKSISVALATYNGEAFIQQQLESIARQSHLPAELVVTDDDSTDGTIGCLERFAKTAPFPVYIHRNTTRLGYRANFMRALSLCQSELVALCDQDDVWDPSKLAVAAAAFDDPDTLLFFHNAWLIEHTGARIGPADIYGLSAYNAPLSAHSLFSPYGFSMVCNRTLLIFSDLWARSVDSNEPQHPMGHDQWLFFLASVFGAIAYSDLRLTDYRQHTSNTFGSPDKTLSAKLAYHMRWRVNNGLRYAQLAHMAGARADLLAESQARLSGVWLDRAIAGERACRRLSDRLRLRARLYGKISMWDRARLVAQLYREGAYTSDGGFGLRQEVLVKDIAFGILLQRLLVPGKTRMAGDKTTGSGIGSPF